MSEEQTAKAEALIREHTTWALGVGLVPIPFLDFVGVTGLQINLLRRLTQLYEVPFAKDLVKTLLVTLLGGAVPAAMSPRLLMSIGKVVPVVGHTLGLASVAMVSAASTYAVGKVFSRHFAEGGHLLSFDPAKVRGYYDDMFQEGKSVASFSKTQL